MPRTVWVFGISRCVRRKFWFHLSLSLPVWFVPARAVNLEVAQHPVRKRHVSVCHTGLEQSRVIPANQLSSIFQPALTVILR
jgi:hypothetical protein